VRQLSVCFHERHTEDLLSDLTARGVRLQVNGDRLRVEAPTGVLTPEVRETLTEHKAELLQLLDPTGADSSPCT
jgi:pyochelin synthetase